MIHVDYVSFLQDEKMNAIEDKQVCFGLCNIFK